MNAVIFYDIQKLLHIKKWIALLTNTLLLYMEQVDIGPQYIIINNNIFFLHLYSAFLGTQSALHSKGGISSSTTSVQHPPGWCDGSHIALERPPHTSLLVERRQWWSQSVDMGIVRRPWWSEANGQIWPGCRGNNPTLFFEGHPGIFNDHRESGPRFNVSSERRYILQYSVPVTILGR